MKHFLLVVMMMGQGAFASFGNISKEALVISVDGGSHLKLETSRRTDHPNLNYSLNQAESLMGPWEALASYRGDGSAVSISDNDYTVAVSRIDSFDEMLVFARPLDAMPAHFYQLSVWLENEALGNYVDDIDQTYLRFRSLDGNKFLYDEIGSDVIGYAADLDVLDYRSHWFIKSSPVDHRYWITNRATGKSIEAASGESTASEFAILQGGMLDPDSITYQWHLHQEDGFYRIESAEEKGMYWQVDTASVGTAGYATLESGSDKQKFSIELLPRGAALPWTAYDEDNYNSLGGGAQVLPPSYDRLLTESEAQKRSAVLLKEEKGYVEWMLSEAANVFTLRYAIEDSPFGGGLNGTVGLEIRDGGGSLVESRLIPVSSEQAWVYFDIDMNESDDSADGRPAKRFNEARVKLASRVELGYTLQLRRGRGEPLIWIDVIETELDKGPITVVRPDEFLNVTDYGAVPNDSGDDRAAFTHCISAAKAARKGVYIPAGEYRLDGRINIGGIVIQGAGMWHTELLFTTVNGGVDSVGFWGEGSDTMVRDLYMRTLSTERGGGGNAFGQYFGTGSRVENVWMEQFDVGGWIGDYISPYDVSDGLTFFNCRIRNTFADGINFARGTRNAVIDNCHFRSTGDDSAASWSSDTTVVPECENNKIRYNTIECNWRAAGVGIFGGEGHDVHHNVVSDVVSGAGLRFNTTFANGTQGYGFSSDDVISVYENSLYRTGTDGGYGTHPTKMGAINLVTTYRDIRNINFKNILIDGVLNYGVLVDRQIWGTGGEITDIVFDGMEMKDVVIGTYVTYSANGAMEYIDVEVELDPERGIDVESNLSSNFEIIHTSTETRINNERELN